ncbi:MAG: HNH endonuclease [Candidatus Bathyarchaeia archaeon]
MSWWEEPKRKKKGVSQSKRELLLYRQKGKCAGCGKSFKRMRVKPHLHHIGKSNRIDALELLCPNCHSRSHTYKTKTDSWTGEKKRKVVKKRMGKKPARKKATKKKKPKKKSDPWSLF